MSRVAVSTVASMRLTTEYYIMLCVWFIAVVSCDLVIMDKSTVCYQWAYQLSIAHHYYHYLNYFHLVEMLFYILD